MTEVKKEPIRNFHKVTDYLYRGGQPGSEGIKYLADMGVRTVICLRWGKKTIETEKTYVEAAGMRFISVRLNYWNLPTQQIIDDFLALVDHEASRPIFVHCLHGADRTGLLIAIYRMAKENWAVEQAYAEMKRCGFHRFRIRNFKWMLWKYARQAKEDGVIT